MRIKNAAVTDCPKQLYSENLKVNFTSQNNYFVFAPTACPTFESNTWSIIHTIQ